MSPIDWVGLAAQIWVVVTVLGLIAGLAALAVLLLLFLTERSRR